ncbi:MAG: NUDIX domain-containing protein [Phycisphaeraceae bacterium]
MTPPIGIDYKIATLCYIFDQQGRILLLHRRKEPNRDLYSPVGGKLDTVSGESPEQCALREIREETGLHLGHDAIRLTGIVSETAYRGEAHWLMFLYEVHTPQNVTEAQHDEGRLEWVNPSDISRLPMPDTDRQVIWPLFWEHRGGFFAVHIDCTANPMTWSVDRSFRH